MGVDMDQLSTVNRQLSTVNCQPSTVNRQLSTRNASAKQMRFRLNN